MSYETTMICVDSKVTVGDTPVRFVIQLSILMRMNDAVERGRKFEAAGRPGAWWDWHAHRL